MTPEKWRDLQSSIKQTIGNNNYRTWIDPLNFSHVEDDVAVFDVPTTILGNYVEKNFGDVILHTLSEAHFTLDAFIVGKPKELAYAAAERVSEGGEVTFNPLFLYGGVGLGKTHLMHATAWELQARRPDLNVLYLSAEQFMYRFVQALRERKMMDFKQLFRSVDVLMVDDVQFIAGKDSTQEEFFHTFNALVDQNKQIIISASREPGEIKDLEYHIKTRMQCG